MTARTRRVIGTLFVVVAFLFIARWSVSFVAERWWAATISPSATAFVTSWQLLGLALDAGAIVMASIWFAIQALLVARAIASVQVAHRFGNLQLREAVPTRVLLGGAIASGILLGLIAGAGAHSWREPILLAWQGVHYGVTEPLLKLDVGVIVGQLPAWDLFHRFAALLAVLGLALCLALYSGIGALRRDKGTLSVHPDARRHLGVLLAFVAIVIAVGYLLTPYHLAAASLQALTTVGLQTRVRTAEIMTGIAAATAILSLAWALRGRNALLAAGWIVLAVGALCERYMVPALAEEGPPTPGRVAMARQFDAIAWGLREAASPVDADAVPAVTAIWDEPLLARLVERGGGALEAATAGQLTTAEGRVVPAWLLATPSPGSSDAMEILAVEDGTTTATGAAIMIRSPEGGRTGRAVWRTMADPRTRPSAVPWRSVAGAVNASTPLRRLLLAWARQAPGMLASQAHSEVDWHLDPTDRAAAVLPMLSWSPADLVLINARPTWLVQGMLVIDQFPLATRVGWRDARVSGVVPAVWSSVDVASGETRFYLDPAVDSLGVAWSRLIGPLVAPANAMPPELKAHATYPLEWLDVQVGVLQEAAWNAGHPPTPSGSAGSPAPVWLSGGRIPGHQVAVEEAGSGAIATTVTAYRVNGFPQIRIERRDSALALGDSRVELRQLWTRATAVTHLRDSVTAAGDTVWTRSPRWSGGAEAGAWQPVFTVPPHGAPTLLWIATGIGDRVGGGRSPAEAWRTATEPDRTTDAVGPSDAATIDLSRQWLQRADSALRRGDMTAFGHAFEELRRALLKRP
jgi:hypothetical protein